MYEQIVDQIRQAIWSGDLPAGTPLPSLRRLARDLEVSLITTTRAYNDLAAGGPPPKKARPPPRRHPPPPAPDPAPAAAAHRPTRPPRGSFVLPQDEAETRERLLVRLDAQLDDAVATARLVGLDLPDLHERTAQRWTEKKRTGGKPAEKE